MHGGLAVDLGAGIMYVHFSYDTIRFVMKRQTRIANVHRVSSVADCAGNRVDYISVLSKRERERERERKGERERERERETERWRGQAWKGDYSGISGR